MLLGLGLQIYAAVGASGAQSAASLFEAHIAFDSSVFFYVLLPPIILDAGYNMQQARFWRNIDSVRRHVAAATILQLLPVAFCCGPAPHHRC